MDHININYIFVNFINLIKKINDGKDVVSDILLGAVLIVFIILGIASLN